jgi:MFS transporter, PAT family, beta-lactamase induction signal transducer AmpG
MRALVQSWRSAFASYAEPQVRAMLVLGFFSGLPFPLLLTTLALRLKQAGIDKSTIGFFSWVGLAYSLKFFWSPVVDRLRLPLLQRLGHRRGWMLFSQIGVVCGLVQMALFSPAAGPEHMALLAVFTAFCAATQDIAVDAYRIESTGAVLQAATTAAYQMGYQLALICGGAGALLLADSGGWTQAYLVMAAIMALSLLATLSVREAERVARAPTAADHARLAATTARLQPLWLLLASMLALLWWVADDAGLFSHVAKTVLLTLLVALTLLRVIAPLKPAWDWLVTAVVFPFVDFYARNGWRAATLFLLLIVTYRLNYTTMGVMAGPFYLDKGYTLTQIAGITKLYGVAMTMAGGLLAGFMVMRLGFARVLIAGTLALAAANLVYAWLATFQPNLWHLTLAISLDNLGNGLAGTAFIAYMSALTNRAYTATQYALFGTLWSLPAKTIAGFSGQIVESLGYRDFFIYTALISLPALLLLVLMLRHEHRQQRREAAVAP